jgi:L-ascorbate metabolism protein UlaG (beta-lactamase superfamily)
MIKRYFSLALAALASSALAVASPALDGDKIPTNDGDLTIHPINHATLALEWKGLAIYVDPVGGAARFAKLPPAGIVLLTDIHGDHLNADTLKAILQTGTKVVAPPAVVEQLPADLKTRAIKLTVGQKTNLAGVNIEAMPAYNVTSERMKFHPKDRGVGYVLTFGGKRIYLSGDTEDIPEMRALKDIAVAFVCMNLPYTMTVEQAADAVRAFKPQIVYPYHYRGSDLEQFKKLVGQEAGVEVRIRDWYAP